MNRYQVGDVIHYSSGGSVHTGTIIEVGDHNHVRVDSSPLTIPPGWILDGSHFNPEAEPKRPRNHAPWCSVEHKGPCSFNPEAES